MSSTGPTRCRHHSLLSSRRRSSSAHSDTMEYEDTDSEVNLFPIKVFLETLEIGSKKYLSSSFGDIELLYESGHSDLVLKIHKRDDILPASYFIKGVSAADISLHSVLPGSLESMVTKIILETNKKISYLEGESDQQSYATDMNIGIVTMTISVHETGHARDLLFLKCNYQDGIIPDLTMHEKLSSQQDVSVDQEEDEPSKHQLTFMEGLPYWVKYIPWMVYSRRTRHVLERILFLYSIFSVLWAMWQLYRHVNIIRVVIQPLILTLRYYLSSVVELFDWIFAIFTVWWHTFLSPLNVLRGLLLVPVWQACIQFKILLTPLFAPIYQLLVNTRVVYAIATVASTLGTALHSLGSILWMLFCILLKPITWLWQTILNYRIAVASMDFQRLRLSWVFSLIINSIKSIANGLAKLVGYRRKEKIKEAIQTSSGPVLSPISSPSNLRRRNDVPILYGSPLTSH